MEESDSPYASPAASNGQPRTAKADMILRLIGAAFIAFIVVVSCFSNDIPTAHRIAGAVVYTTLAIGLIRLGRRFCLGLSLFFVFSISVQAYFSHKAISDSQAATISTPSMSWMTFGISIIPHLIVLACSFALFVRLPPRIDNAKSIGLE